MKRSLVFLLPLLLAVSCNDSEQIIGEERIFTVEPTTTDWPRNEYGAISRTYRVTVGGAVGDWTAELLDGEQGFNLETDHASNTFTVSIGENTGKDNIEDYVCVTYSGEMIYLSLIQISNYFSVDPGADMGGGVYKYTVGADGTSIYVGLIANPGNGTVSVTYVSGDEDVFTPVLEPADKPATLRFTAPANVEFFAREAVFSVSVSDKPDQTFTVTAYQEGLELPVGAMADREAPGGYYYPLVCGIDVAGVNIPVDPDDTWNDVFDPEGILGNDSDVNMTAPVNPCPEGWNAPTEAQMRRILAADVWTCNKNVPNTEPDYFYWNMRDGSHSDCDIFGATRQNPEIRLWSSETRPNAQPQAWRLRVNRSSSPLVEISSAGRTTVMGEGNYSYIVRCVREAQ